MVTTKKAPKPTAAETALHQMIAAREARTLDPSLVLALAIADLTDLVKVDDTVDPPTVDPENLFELTFDDPKVGMDDALVELLKANLSAAFPEIASDIALIDASATLKISDVDDFIRLSLANTGGGQ